MAAIRTGLIGTGSRAHSYGNYISRNGEDFELAAVADLIPDKLNSYAEDFHVPATARYSSVDELLDRGPELDALVITTNDASHEMVAISAFEAGLPVLLEKPIAVSAEGAYRVVHAADAAGVSLTIGLVLRYTPFYRKVKELVDGGAVGRMVQVEAKEVLHVHHTATSFMREHYRLREDCGSFVLTKCCHDFDIFNWIVDATPVRVASFGGLDYFLPRERRGPAMLRVRPYADMPLLRSQGVWQPPFVPKLRFVRIPHGKRHRRQPELSDRVRQRRAPGILHHDSRRA